MAIFNPNCHQMPASLRSSPSSPAPQLRCLHGDEQYVLDLYQRHAERCSTCADPGGSLILCQKGAGLARDVIRYIYQRGGQFFACRSHQGDNTNQVAIPVHAHAARTLLAAVEHGHLPGSSSQRIPNTGSADPRSFIQIVERQPRFAEKTHAMLFNPFSCRKGYWYLQRSPHQPLFRSASPGFRVGITYKPRGLVIRVEMDWYST